MSCPYEAGLVSNHYNETYIPLLQTAPVLRRIIQDFVRRDVIVLH
jgi:hypothetical protein